MLENEQSFLVAKMPSLDDVPFKNIEQYYLSESPEPLRIRRADDTFEITKKLTIDPNDRARREEINIPLTEKEYERLHVLALRGLTKRRYYFPLDGGLKAELDVFLGPLEGFIKVEVEFPNEASREAFTPPDWFGRNISEEKWSSNSWLAGKTYDDVRPFLAQ